MGDRRVYVVSEDLHLLLDRWSEQRFGLTFDLPYDKIRAELAEILTFGGHVVVQVSAEDMRSGMERLLVGERRPIVSVDPVYVPSDLMLQITRCVDPDTLASLDGVHARHGFPPPDVQIDDIVARLRSQYNGAGGDVVLVDDVVFSGKVVMDVIGRLAAHGVRVSRVVCGIAVIEVGESDPFRMCADLGATLDAAFTFGTEGSPSVVDEICERDFFVFSPMSGRSATAEVNIGFPYICPFGLAEKWATLKGFAHDVSRKLIGLNAWIIEMIEVQLGRPLVFSDLERLPVRVRHPDIEGESVRLHLLAHLR